MPTAMATAAPSADRWTMPGRDAMVFEFGRQEQWPPESGRPFTRKDLEHTPDDGRRYEIIDGTLIVSAAPSRLHQRAVVELLFRLRAACPADCEVLVAPFAVALAEDTEMQPDILVGRRADFTDRELPVAPLLAVEVLSPSTRLIDVNVKRERFRRARTPSFWTVDPIARPAEARLTVWELGKTKRYRKVATVTGDEAYTATQPFPVTVVPADLVR
jgi:Uma2 family endonuclease